MKMLKNDGRQTQLSSPLSLSLSLHSNRAKILFTIGLDLLRSLYLWTLPSHTGPSPPLPQDMKLSSSHLQLFLITIYSAVFQSFSQPQSQPTPETETAIKLVEKIQIQRQSKTSHGKQEESSHSLLQRLQSPQNKSAGSIRFQEHVVSFKSESGSEISRRRRRDTNQDSTSNPDTTEYYNNTNDTTALTSPNTENMNSTFAPKLTNETDVSYPVLGFPSFRDENSTPPFECSQLDDLFPATLPDGTEDDECSYHTDFCENTQKKYEGKQLYNEPCATPQDLMSIIKRLPLGTSNREKNLRAQNLLCNTTKSLTCYLVADGKLTPENNRETLYLCGCDLAVGKDSYSEKTGKCFIPFGETINLPCDMEAEEAARHGHSPNNHIKRPSKTSSSKYRGGVQKPNTKEILLCREDLECSRKSISKRQKGNDSLVDFHCYCPEGKELQEINSTGTKKCVNVEILLWQTYFRMIVGIFMSIVSFSIIFGGILHVELSDPRPGIASRGFRRKPPKLLTAVSSINLNLLDLSVASDESKLLLSPDQPSDV